MIISLQSNDAKDEQQGDVGADDFRYERNWENDPGERSRRPFEWWRRVEKSGEYITRTGTLPVLSRARFQDFAKQCTKNATGAGYQF